MNTQIISYQNQETKLNVYYHNRTFWLTLENISKLFQSDIKSVFQTLKEILQNEDLNEKSVNQHIEIPSQSGARLLANSYNLDIVMAIGYRLNVKEATRFRIWSMNIISKGINLQNSLTKFAKQALLSIF